MRATLGNWWTAGLAAVFGGIGWLAADLNTHGVSSAQEPAALGGLTIVGVLGLAWTIFSRWKTGGGKLDGKLTEKEFSDLATALLEKINPNLIPYIDKVDGPAAAAINKIISPTATKLIEDLSSWFVDKTPDPNEQVLNFKVLELLQDSLKGSPDAVAAIATLKAVVANQPSSVSVTVV